MASVLAPCECSPGCGKSITGTPLGSRPCFLRRTSFMLAGRIAATTHREEPHDRDLQGHRRQHRRPRRPDRDPAPAPQLLRQCPDQPDRRRARGVRPRSGVPRRGALRAGQVVLRGRRLRQPADDRRGQRERQAPLQGSDPDLPVEEAHRRGGAGRRHRRRARPGARRRLPRHLQRGALQRQFQPARLSSRLQPDLHAAAPGRPAEGQPALLHGPARDR